MKKRMSKYRFTCCIAVVSAVFIGWVAHAGSNQDGVNAIIKHALELQSHASVADADVTLPGNVTQVHLKYNGQTFWAETRKDKISRFKCSQCHNNSTVTAENAAAVAHGDIVLDHGDAQTPLACFTCHKEDQRDLLETQKGITVEMDHVYELCGQCHFRQKADWIGGAHGKRLHNWAGKRVAANCTSCHDPHSPLFKKRMPATYSLPLD